MNEAFIEERRYGLNQFLKNLCQQRYLASSPETQIFLRPRGEVVRNFKNLEDATTTHMLKYYRVKVPIEQTIEQIGE